MTSKNPYHLTDDQLALFTKTVIDMKYNMFGQSPEMIIKYAIIESIPLVCRQIDDEYQLYFYSESRGYYIPLDVIIDDLVHDAIIVAGFKILFLSLCKNVRVIMAKGFNVREKFIPYNPPPKDWELFINGVYNTRTNEKVSENQVKGYHFLSKHHYPFYTEESPSRETSKRLVSSDNVMLYYQHLSELGVLEHNSHLPLNILYEGYRTWLKSDNPTAQPLSKRGFVDRSVDVLQTYGFQLSRQPKGDVSRIRITNLKCCYFNRVQFESLLNTSLSDWLKANKQESRSSVFINESHTVSEELISQLKENPTDVDVTNLEHQRAIVHLIVDEKDTTMMSLYGTQVDTFY